MVGSHLIVDAFGCDPEILNDADLLERTLTQLLQELGMEILHTYFHRFHPYGVTGTIVISTSHLAIHTWPEKRYAAFDLFTCGSLPSVNQLENLLKQLSAEKCVVYQLARGKRIGQMPTFREFHLFGENKKAPLPGRAHVHVGNELLDSLSRKTDITYHQALVHPVFSMAHSRHHVLIIGACDEQLLREIRAYQDVDDIHHVDIDFAASQENFNMVQILSSQVNSLRSPLFPTRRRRKYDVILLNLPDPANEEISRYYSSEFFLRVSSYLAPHGLMVCPAHSPNVAPLVFWSIAETIESAGLSTLSYHLRMKDHSDRGFHLAGTSRPLRRKIAFLSAGRELAQQVGSWFAFDEQILRLRNNAVINTLHELTLHVLYQQAVGKSE